MLHSLTLRRALFSDRSGEVPVVLCTIEHDELVDGPLRLSSDDTERISIDPYVKGTRSNGNIFYFVMMGALLPDDEEGTPQSTSLVFENVDRDMAALLRSVTSPATVTLQLVLASTPDQIEEQYRGLKAVRGTYDANRVTLEISREPFTSEPWPSARMTKGRFPGLFA